MILVKVKFNFPEGIEKILNTVVNVYVLRYRNLIIQIDAGIKTDSDKIIKFYKELGIKPDYILITAVDYVHVGALREIYDQYNPKIYVPNREMGSMKNGPALNGILEIEGKGLRFEGIQHVYSYNKMDIDFLEVIGTPGYSMDNVSIYLKDRNSIFVGDALVVRRHKIKLDAMFTQNMEIAENSIAKIKSFCPVTIFPAHGEPYECE
jgi:glyoxylase-like metal-dependent hydrolase (beta-lactamase superfamily II)